MWNRLVPVAIAILLAAATGTAQAVPDEQAPGQKGRREKALADLDKEVAKLVALVKNVDKKSPCGASAAGGRPKARRMGRAAALGGPFCPEQYAPIKKKLQDLISVVSSNSGSDPRAGAVISFWPQYVVSFETRLGDLANMTANHKSALTTGQACKKTSDAMISRGKTALVNKSLDEFDAAQVAATKDKTDVTSWLSTQGSVQSSMTQWERNTRLFQPDKQHDKAWKPVFQAMHASSKKMLDNWNADWTQASKLCAEPAKGQDHAELKQLEDRLYATLKEELLSDIETWREKTKALYRYDCESMKKLQEYYCGVRDGDAEVVLDEFEADDGNNEVGEDFPVDGDKEDLQYEAQADKMAAEMAQKQHVAWTELAGFRSRAGRLEANRNGRMGTVDAYKAWKAELEELVDTQIKPEEKAIEDVVAKGIARGSRNPKIQLWIEFGKQQHAKLETQDRFKCTLADEGYCRWRWASGPRKGKCARWTRPDCVSVTQCKIWEFKPVNGADRGEKQVGRYKRLLERHYNKAMELFRNEDPRLGSFDLVGGMDVLKALESSCLQGDKITFEKEVHRYPKCGADIEYQCAPQAK